MHKLYLDPNDGCQDFFCQVANAYWDKVQEQFHFKTHLDNKWFNLQGKLVVRMNTFLINYKTLPNLVDGMNFA